MRKKRNDLFEYENITTFFKTIKKNIGRVRKNLGKSEQPYSEVSQDYKRLVVKVTLPDVKKRNLKLKISDNLIEIRAERNGKKGDKFKTFYRTIEVPSNALTNKAKAKFKNNILKISIPKAY